MTTTEISLRSTRWVLALLGGMAGLLLTAPPAQAQPLCGSLDDTAEEALELYVEELDDEFALGLGDDELCTTLTKNFIKACQTAVKDTVKCIQNQIKGLNKQNQAACKALEGPGASECTAFFKNQAQAISEEVDAEGSEQADVCAIFAADEFFDLCFFGEL